MDRERGEYRCSFCDKQRSQVHHLFEGADGVFICDECVALSSTIVADARAIDARAKKPPRAWLWFWRR